MELPRTYKLSVNSFVVLYVSSDIAVELVSGAFGDRSSTSEVLPNSSFSKFLSYIKNPMLGCAIGLRDLRCSIDSLRSNCISDIM